MKVLIAEDNQVWRKLLAEHLQRFGFDYIEAADGQAAWDILCQADAPRLVLLDWQMPELDGIEVCRRIKQDENRGFTYVILLTSRDAKEDMVSGLDAGADDYLTKPVDAAVLRSRLRAARRIIEAVPPKEWTKPQIPGYEVTRLIGKGAFATVWEAHRDGDPQPLALKVLRVDLATEDVFGRFAREIEVMKRLDHPHIAHIYDSRIDHRLGYYAMDLIQGDTLDRFVKKHKPSGMEIIQMVADVCDGLQHAHQQGVIHRDLKPSNIMVSEDQNAKLVDFGLSKTMFWPPSSEDSAETLDGAVIGSPLFMAPEQARGENERLDERSDVYSVGVVLYMMLLRRHPQKLVSKERWETIKQIAEGQVQPPTSLNPKFSRTLEAIIMKALDEDPEKRYQSAGEMAAALRAFVARRTQNVR
ncbi:protein kinase domain-containing protein [Roseimaritima ulvae]|uniref:Serine/threonine-protein kinase PknB n=1 Tax=Roseimaritima ulvae TaxID=980254 RepID=A0A5B9QHE1_9BACT|nr:protein kinase [Roseimaritima ulvae]QEG38547.1 Serine/threonine-protein kinase PknB [Roseimaritima ulvae]